MAAPFITLNKTANATHAARILFNDMNGILLALKGQAKNANAVDFSTRIG